MARIRQQQLVKKAQQDDTKHKEEAIDYQIKLADTIGNIALGMWVTRELRKLQTIQRREKPTQTYLISLQAEFVDVLEEVLDILATWSPPDGNCSAPTNNKDCSVTPDDKDCSAKTDDENCSATIKEGDRSVTIKKEDCSATTDERYCSAMTDNILLPALVAYLWSWYSQRCFPTVRTEGVGNPFRGKECYRNRLQDLRQVVTAHRKR